MREIKRKELLSLLTLKGSRSCWVPEVAGVDDRDVASDARPWYYNRLMELDSEGWVTANIEDYLGADETLGAERLLYLDYALELAQSLQERTAYLGRSAHGQASDLVEAWAGDLEDPMNAERIFDEYEAWAKEWRPWEPALYRSEEAWRDEGLEELHAGLLSRFDGLDPSSKPSTVVLLPLLAYSNEFETIDQALGGIEEDEKRQLATIDRASTMLGEAGYDVSGIDQMDILDSLDRVARLHDLHDMHEDLRLFICEQIAPFDPELAAHHERRRVALIEQGERADIGGLRIQISAISDNLHQRMAMLNDVLNGWRGKGIIFPHEDGIRANELLEWEANLPEIEATLERHFTALSRWRAITEVWPEEEVKAAHCAGVLEKTEAFIDIVDDLDQRWKRLELECLNRVEIFEHGGLVMDAWHERIQRDPKFMLEELKRSQSVLGRRIEFIGQLQALDISFEGAVEVEQRKNLLRELDVDQEVLDDCSRFIEHHARRGARHRRMLEQDWRGLVAQGKASASTATSSFSLAAFEDEIAHIRRFGTSIGSSRTGASIIAGDVHDRLTARMGQELALLAGSGWAVEELRQLAEEDTVLAARKLNATRPAIEEHATLVRRLMPLPWNRDVALALDVEASLRDPLKLSLLEDRIAGYARHLATRPVEDENFELTAWAPKPHRRTLVPVPEHASVPTMMPADALGDAHEAILDAMDGKEVGREPSRMSSSGAVAKIVRPNDPVNSLDLESKPVRNIAPVAKVLAEVYPTPPQPTVKTVNREVALPLDESISHGLAEFLRAIDVDELAQEVEMSGVSALPNIRRGLAKHVGQEPRDTRIDRLLRLSLRLMPQGDEDDPRRIALLIQLAKNTKKIKRWMRVRLEHRHSGSSKNFLADASELGGALRRIPGPGHPLPLSSDQKELPDAANLTMLEAEVTALIGHMNPNSAGGISA